MTYTLADLDAMSIEDAQALPFEERDALLDLIIADGRHQTTDLDSYRVGLYGDYFDEDLTRMLKVKAIKVHVRGTTASGFDGVRSPENPTKNSTARRSGMCSSRSKPRERTTIASSRLSSS